MKKSLLITLVINVVISFAFTKLSVSDLVAIKEISVVVITLSSQSTKNCEKIQLNLESITDFKNLDTTQFDTIFAGQPYTCEAEISVIVQHTTIAKTAEHRDITTTKSVSRNAKTSCKEIATVLTKLKEEILTAL